MEPLATAVQDFLLAHREGLLGLISTGGPLDKHQVEVHTLAGIARMFPSQARFLRLQVEPGKGQRGSVVMSSVLEVQGQWFELEGPRAQEQVWEKLIASGRKGAKKGCTFTRLVEESSTRAPHPVVQPYLQQHLPAFVAAAEARVLENHTASNPRETRSPRL